MGGQFLESRRRLGGCLLPAVDDLRDAAAQLAVVVDLGATDILVGHVPQRCHSIGNAHLARADPFQQPDQLFLVQPLPLQP